MHGDVLNFTVQGLQDALNVAESAVTEPPPPADEFIIQLEVTMAGLTWETASTSLLVEWGFGVSRIDRVIQL